jgi:murein DD-endopeptidase MepM/ murein hydrolase activator NlpD
MAEVDYHRPCKTREIRDDFADHVKRHSALPGVDYACATGDKVWATANGIVVACSGNPNQVRGKNVTIRHRDGRLSHYLHLSKVNVSNGQRVKAKQIIGLSGNTGTTTTGAHLHFAIQNKDGRCVDPERLLRKDSAARRVAEEVPE